MSGSALDRLREKYEERQVERALEVELWSGALLARVSLVEGAGAKGAFKTLASLADDGGSLDLGLLDPNDMADLISEAVVGLYYVSEDGSKEQVLNDSGTPVVFDSGFGALIGAPEATTPRAAVFAAFTEGDPPKVNTFAMLTVASQIAAWLVDPEASVEAVAAKGL